MEIFVFVHLFYHDDFTVGRSYDNVFRVPFETSDRASEEIDYDKVDDRAYGCRNIERELAFKSIVKAGVEQQQHPCTRDERVRSFPMYSDFKFIPLYKDLGNYWQPVDAANGDYTAANPNAEFPRIYGNYGNQGSNYRQSDKYLSDASYFRIKNVTLSYTFPKAWITKASLSQLKAFVSIENLATFSSLPKGIDPETLSWNYPAFRTVSFGLNVTL